MPELKNGKWYLTDGDELVADTVDKGGKCRHPVDAQANAEVRFYDADLDEQFAVTYDWDDCPDKGRMCLDDPDGYTAKLEAAGDPDDLYQTSREGWPATE